MKKNINIRLYKNNRLLQENKSVNSIFTKDEIIFLLDGVKTYISDELFKRETNEYLFELNIKEKQSTYLLKTINQLFDIDVENINSERKDNSIILEYKISTDEETNKVIIDWE